LTEPPSSEGPLQFGRREPDVLYRDRTTAHGVAARMDGRIACVRVSGGRAAPYLDLPGGGVDPGEDRPAALVREFGEETGLVVEPGRVLVRCAQFMRMETGEPVNNHGELFETIVLGEDAALKVEADHEPVWRVPEEAVAHLRLDSHAWAVAAWLRRRRS